MGPSPAGVKCIISGCVFVAAKHLSGNLQAKNTVILTQRRRQQVDAVMSIHTPAHHDTPEAISTESS